MSKNIYGQERTKYQEEYLLKHGYDEFAIYETFQWFIYTMKSVLKQYKKTHVGYPTIDKKCMELMLRDCHSDEYKKARKKNDKKYDRIIGKMIKLLDDMNEDNSKYDGMDYIEASKKQNKAKNKFFKLFSEWFWTLWD